jgi:hypothetical protein
VSAKRCPLTGLIRLCAAGGFCPRNRAISPTGFFGAEQAAKRVAAANSGRRRMWMDLGMAVLWLLSFGRQPESRLCGFQAA